MNQERLILAVLAFAAVPSLAFMNRDAIEAFASQSTSSAHAAPVSDTAATDAPAAADETPSPTPDGNYEGKVDDLPDVAKAVMNFTPADTPNETTSESIRDRVVDVCALQDYVGSTDFPGTVDVSPPRSHGWVRVIWKPGKCGSPGGSLHANPKLIFELSADQEHIRYVADGADQDGGNAAYDLTH